MHAYHGRGLRTGPQQRIPPPFGIVQAWQAKLCRKFTESDSTHTTSGVSAHLGRGELDVPQRDQTERDKPATAVAAPLLDHPVVIGVHTRQREVLVLGFVESLAAEPGEGREAQGSFDMIHIHIDQTCRRLVESWPHLVVPHRFLTDLLRFQAGGRHSRDHCVPEVLVHPPVGLRAARGHPKRPAVCRDHLVRRTYHPWARLPVPAGQPVPPQVRRLNHVVVHGNDGRNVSCHRTSAAVSWVATS